MNLSSYPIWLPVNIAHQFCEFFQILDPPPPKKKNFHVLCNRYGIHQRKYLTSIIKPQLEKLSHNISFANGRQVYTCMGMWSFIIPYVLLTSSGQEPTDMHNATEGSR